MTRPATAGPIMRAALNEVELSATAFDRSASPHQLGDEGLAHRRIERRAAAEQEGEHIDVPELHHAGDGQKPEPQRERAHRGLRRHQQLALIEMIGRKAGPRHQQELRSELQRHHDADRGCAVIA